MGDEDLKARLCIIRKWDDFPGYGFNLHAERGRAGQYIGKVDDDSPAQAAGMKEGDRIVEVQGTNIGNENHSQVVTRIKAAGESVTMLLVDSETDKYYKEQKVVVSSQMSGVSRRETPVPRPGANEQQEEVPEPESEPPAEPPSYNEVQEADEEEEPATPPPEPEPEQDRAPSPDTVPVLSAGTQSHNYHPRLCHIKKVPNFQGYGFNLHAEKDKKGQYIGLVDAGSPSEDVDLRKGDRIIEVNGENIEEETHQQVIQKIKTGGDETIMLVVDAEADEYYKNNGIRITAYLPEVIENKSQRRVVSEEEPVPEIPQIVEETATVDEETASVNEEATPDVEETSPVDEETAEVNVEPVPVGLVADEAPSHDYHPRLCHIRKWPDFQGYGFNLHADKDKNGQYIGLVDADSPSDDADLRKGDRIIAVNGENVEEKAYQQVIQLIKAGGDETKLLVVDSEADEYYKNNRIQITADLPEVIQNETRQKEAPAMTFHPRQCHVIKRPDFQGYGFNLHAEKERGGQYIGTIDDNSPAQEAGLKEHDRIIEVNNQNIENETHQQVIAKIKAGGDETKLLVVDKEADQYYKSRGITVTSSMPEVQFHQSNRSSRSSANVTNGERTPATQPTRVFSKKKAPSPPKSPLRAQTEGELFAMSAQEARNHIQHVHRQKSDKRLSKPDIKQKVNLFEQL